MKWPLSFLSWSGKASIEVDIPDDTEENVRLKVALEIAVKKEINLDYLELPYGARLVGARLDGASLDGASLDGASLDGASLDGASLVGASLDGASLVRASLDGASLVGASLDGASLVRASLDGARLVGARLVRARLDRARLVGASLVRASLDGASLDGASLDGASLVRASLEPKLTWEQYLSDVVPALLTAGGKTLAEVLATGCWRCHTWDNCPMHAAFGIKTSDEGPVLLRPRIKEFVRFFDSGLIPEPKLPEQQQAAE
jgi:hypothetical protein